MPLELRRSWLGTAEGLCAELERVIAGSKLKADAPSLRTVRLWRAKGLLTRAGGSRFALRQVLEGLATAVLLKKHWSTAAIADLLPTLTDSDLESHLAAEAGGVAAA